jgi:hypothetical protein
MHGQEAETVQTSEFRRQVGARGALGLNDERIRKVGRVLARTPEVRAEGFGFLAEDKPTRSRGGVEVTKVDAAFLVLAGLEEGPIGEALGRRCYELFTSPSQDWPREPIDTGTKTRRKRVVAAFQCPVTGAKRAGDALKAILSDPALAARVERLTLYRTTGDIVIRWKSPDARSSFQHPVSNPPWDQRDVIVAMRGEVVQWLAELLRQPAPAG